MCFSCSFDGTDLFFCHFLSVLHYFAKRECQSSLLSFFLHYYFSMDIVGGYTLRKRCYDEDFNAYSQEVCPPYPVFCNAMEMDWDGKRMRDNRPLLPFISPSPNYGYAEPTVRRASVLPPQARSDLYKTRLCKHFMSTGSCRYGNKCQFAHGVDELRSVQCCVCYKQETDTGHDRLKASDQG